MGNIINFSTEPQEDKKQKVLRIEITKTNKIKCYLGDGKQQKRVIQFKNQEEINPCIQFQRKRIIVCENNSNAIHFMNNWINNPIEMNQLYTIEYNGNTYSLLPEMLFGLVMYQIKQQINEKYIIVSSIISIQQTLPKKFITRMKFGLQSVGFRGIYCEKIDYDYTNQIKYVNEILFDYHEYKKEKEILQHQIERKSITTPVKETLQQITRDRSNFSINYQNPNKNITLQMPSIPMKHQRMMKLYRLTSQCLFHTSKYFETLDDHINLLFVSKTFRSNMELFKSNPIPLTPKTRHFFPNIQTLNIFNSCDYLFKTDKHIQTRKLIYIQPYNLFSNQIRLFQEWTGLKCSTILFDSTIDNWSQNTSTFDSKIIGKKHLLFFLQDDENKTFGYYLDTEISPQYFQQTPTNEQSFFFIIDSNGRIQQPIKCEIREPRDNGYMLYPKEYETLIELGEMTIMKSNQKHKSFFFQTYKSFYYHEINLYCLRRKNHTDNNLSFVHFIPKRILVIQMI